MGLENLTDNQQKQVNYANRLLAVTLSIARLASRVKTPWIIENPRASMLWSTPGFISLGKKLDVQFCHLDQCGYGAPWRKSTTLAAFGMHGIESLRKHADLSCASVPFQAFVTLSYVGDKASKR